MIWNLDKGRPLCPQICEQLCKQIALGNFQPNQRMYSVRELAIEAGVNPNTVQKAFETMEQQGLLYSVRGAGWYVAEEISLAQKILENIRMEKTAAFFAEMQALGMLPEEIKSAVKEWKA